VTTLCSSVARFLLLGLLTGALAVSAGEVGRADDKSAKFTAEALDGMCKEDPGTVAGALCAGFLFGINASVHEMPALLQAGGGCIPGSANVGVPQIKKIFEEYLEAHPEDKKEDGRAIILAAIGLAFPCPKNSEPQNTAGTHDYDDCILEHMGTAQNESAAYAIQRACISKASIGLTPISTPSDLDATAWAGSFNVINSWNYGLLVRIKNSTSFNITELVVEVSDRKTNKTNEYVIDSFDEPAPTGVIITKLGEPAYRNMIPVGKTRSFFVPASEVTKETTNDFFKRFTWNLRLSKGIPTETIK
jgi:Rap1a immunity proteins